MAFIRRYRLRKPLYRRRPVAARRVYVRRAARPRALNPSPTFTETTNLGSVALGPTGTYGGTLAIRFQDIPQFSQYANLYAQFCIRRVQFMLMPNYNSFDQAGPLTAVALAPSAPRICWAVNDSAQLATPVPLNEIDVLLDNGCKIRNFTKPIKIVCRPVAEVAVGQSIGGFVSESKKNRWLSTQSAATLHQGAQYFVTQDHPQTGATPINWNVYAKVTFSLKDPQ